MPKTDLSLDDVHTFLQERYPDPISELTPLVEGEESQAFSFVWAGRAYVLRINRRIDGFAKDAYAYQHFHSSAIPIPQVVAVGRIDAEHAFCVSRRMPGRSLQNADLATVARVQASLLQVWRALGRVDVSQTMGFGLYDACGRASFPSWRASLSSILDPAHYDWAGYRHALDAEWMDPIVTTFRHLVRAVPEERRLVHGDFGANNVLTDGQTVTAVLDWDCAQYGDPLFDVATAYFWRTWLACMDAFAQYCEHHLHTLPCYRARITCYQLWIGLREIYENLVCGDAAMLAWLQRRSLAIVRTYRRGFDEKG